MPRWSFPSAIAAFGLAPILLAGLASAAERPPPMRLTNTASFATECTLFVAGTGVMAGFRLKPGDTHVQRIPANREVRLICMKGKTRDRLLTPGESYSLIEVEGRLELVAAAPPPRPQSP